jgi:hypothetical protein
VTVLVIAPFELVFTSLADGTKPSHKFSASFAPWKTLAKRVWIYPITIFASHITTGGEIVTIGDVHARYITIACTTIEFFCGIPNTEPYGANF